MRLHRLRPIGTRPAIVIRGTTALAPAAGVTLTVSATVDAASGPWRRAPVSSVTSKSLGLVTATTSPQWIATLSRASVDTDRTPRCSSLISQVIRSPFLSVTTSTLGPASALAGQASRQIRSTRIGPDISERLQVAGAIGRARAAEPAVCCEQIPEYRDWAVPGRHPELVRAVLVRTDIAKPAPASCADSR